MLSINNRAFETAVKKNSSFVIKPVTVPCGWAGSIKSLGIELMKNFNDDKNYSVMNFQGVKVFIHKSLKIGENIEIIESIKLPILGSSFRVKGITPIQNL